MPTNPFLAPIPALQPKKWGRAACVEWDDPEIWFPEHISKGNAKLAKEICDSCPLKDMCRTEFDRETWGIFGGSTPAERHPGRWAKNVAS